MARGPTSDDVRRVEAHLKGFSDPLEPPEQAMLDRCKAGEWTEFDQRFVEHELLEAELMRNGIAGEDAHQQALAAQGIAYQRGYEAYLYHPSVVLDPVLGEWFNAAARELSARLQGGKGES